MKRVIKGSWNFIIYVIVIMFRVLIVCVMYDVFGISIVVDYEWVIVRYDLFGREWFCC